MQKAREGKRPLLVEKPLFVCTYDIDMHRHVNNGVYIRWLEDLRYEVLRVYYPPQRMVAEDVLPVLHSTNIVYHKPLQLFDEPLGRMWCSKIGRATLSLEAEIRLGETICASASQRLMLVKIGSSKPARLPQELADQFQAQNG